MYAMLELSKSSSTRTERSANELDVVLTYSRFAGEARILAKICSVIRGVIPFISSLLMSGPCKNESCQRACELCARSESSHGADHHRVTLSGSSLPVRKHCPVVAIHDI